MTLDWKNMPDDYAIVVLTFNHPDLSSKCLDSIISVTNNISIIVIHNGSDKKNIALLSEKYPLLDHIVLEKNIGFSGGANFGLNHAFKNKKNILFLTNDTELLKIPNTPPQGFQSVTIKKRNTELIDSIYGEIDFKYGRLKHLKEVYQVQNLKIYIPGTAFLIDKKTFEKLNGFDEKFHTYWEDVDFSYRAQINNIQLGHSSETIIKHKIGKTCHKNDFYTYYLFQRNRKKFILKHKKSSIIFWIVFLYDIIKYCKYRLHYLWRILND